METVVWVVERNFGSPNHSDWRYWAFPSRYLDEAWSKDWNLAIKTHDRDSCERICEDMPDHWEIRICDHQIVDVTLPNYQTLTTRNELLERAIKQAIKGAGIELRPDGRIEFAHQEYVIYGETPDLATILKEQQS